jgi:hypothetical protein
VPHVATRGDWPLGASQGGAVENRTPAADSALWPARPRTRRPELATLPDPGGKRRCRRDTTRSPRTSTWRNGQASPGPGQQSAPPKDNSRSGAVPTRNSSESFVHGFRCGGPSRDLRVEQHDIRALPARTKLGPAAGHAADRSRAKRADPTFNSRCVVVLPGSLPGRGAPPDPSVGPRGA